MDEKLTYNEKVFMCIGAIVANPYLEGASFERISDTLRYNIEIVKAACKYLTPDNAKQKDITNYWMVQNSIACNNKKIVG